MSCSFPIIGLLGVVGTLLSGPSTDQLVSTTHGPVQGRQRTSSSLTGGYNYYSFQGIRYAQPPVGHLRFKDPVLPLPSFQTFDARAEGPSCHGYTSFIHPNVNPNEDCLNLNVYSKTLGPHKKSPVMVFIYGGTFITGSSSELIYGPDLLLQKDIVIVTFNYRMGVLGFLSHSDPKFNTPGNAALKDQSMALRWVKANILNFGGDPDNITLFGESAGSASVHYQMISDYSKNLFNKAILESGSSLTPWALTPPGDFKERLATSLGWDNSTGQDGLMTLLRSMDPVVLTNSIDVCTPAEDLSGTFLGFGPVIEPYDNGNCFLPATPSKLAKHAWSNKNPALIGGNSEEGYAFVGLLAVEGNLLADPYVYQHLLPAQLKLKLNSRKSIALGESLRQFYFGNDTLNPATLGSAALLIGDKYLWQGQTSAVKARLYAGNHAPTYLYRFTFDSAVLTFMKLYFINAIVPGAVHAEELMYLWNMAGINTDDEVFSPGTIENKVKNYMVEVWTKFASTGNPVTSKTPGWLPVVPGAAPLKCMNFDTENTFITLPETPRIAFWDNLYSYV